MLRAGIRPRRGRSERRRRGPGRRLSRSYRGRLDEGDQRAHRRVRRRRSPCRRRRRTTIPVSASRFAPHPRSIDRDPRRRQSRPRRGDAVERGVGLGRDAFDPRPVGGEGDAARDRFAGASRNAARNGAALAGSSRTSVSPATPSAPLGWTWAARLQKFSGKRCWQTKKPVSGSAGLAAKASENATSTSRPSGRRPLRAKSKRGEAADPRRFEARAGRPPRRRSA